MPNGGSDCCGTCPFNRKNRGEAGYAHTRDPGPDHCDIRDLPIEGAFWTYCANHPGHNPDRIRIPVGPVYVSGDGFPYGRKPWRPSPDSEEVRLELLRIAAATTAEPVADYPAGRSLAETAVEQLGEFGEARAIPDLERIRQFTGTDQPDDRPFARDPRRLAALARAALARIIPPADITPFRTDTVRAVATGIDAAGDPAGLPALADALEEAGCAHAVALAHLRDPAVRLPSWVIDVILDRVGDAPPG